MKRLLFLIACAVLIVFGGSQLLKAQTPTAPDEKPGQVKKRGGIFTMYVNDPLSRTLCFSDGKEGMAFEKYSWGNRCSDLSYNLAGNGSFVAGIEVNRIAAIVDLGTPNELRSKYGYEDANEGGEGFASLHLEGDKIMVLKDNSPQDTYQPVQEAAKLFSDVGPSATAPIKLGHIYLVRIADKKDKTFQQVVKLMVIAYRPDEAVTLRWYLL
jgi:hypothetical protein